MNYKKLLVAFVFLAFLPLTSYGQTFYTMSSGNYTQDFANISGWTNNYASGTGAANWRVASSVATSTVSTTTVFSSGTSGGVQIGTTSMVILATGNLSTATDLLLDFTGRTAGTISLDWLKVTNTVNASPKSSDLKIQYSVDNGVTFADLTGYTIPRINNNATGESGSLSSITLPAALDNKSQVVIRLYVWNNGQTGGSGNRPKYNIDNINVTSTGSCTAPTTQASNITFSNVAATTMDVNWTNGNGAGRVVKMNTSNSFTAPTNGSVPSASTTYGSGEQVVYAGTGSGAISISGLAASTTYWYRVYEYCTTGNIYQTATATNNPLSQATTSPTPAVTLANNGTQITAANVPQGTTNHILSSFQLTVANATTNLTQASFLALGNYQAADINGAGFTLWYKSTNNFGTAATLGTALSSTSTGSGDVLTFTGFSQALAVGTSYFWVTANISSTATTTRYINIDTIANADLIFSSGTKSGSASAAGNQTITPLTKTTIADGDWANAAIWSPAGVPTSSQNVVINHIVTSIAVITRDSGTTTTINANKSLAVSATYTNNGTTTVNGTFQLDSGGWATGSNFTYGVSGTLVFNSSTNYGVNSTDVFWPSSNSPFNVTILQGGMTMNATTIRSVAGTFSVGGAGVTITSPSTLTITGTCLINAGGFFNNSPIYGASSLLKYNSTGTYRRGFEWLANGVGTIGTTAGYPNNVQLSNNTTLDYNNGNPANKAMNGSLTIDAGSTFTMADTTMGAPSAGTLTIAGSVTNNGTFTFADVATPVVVAGNYTNAGATTMGAVAATELRITGNFINSGTTTLGTFSGSDLRVGGDFTNSGTFTANARAVYFTKTGTQLVTSPGTLTIPYLRTTGTGTTVQLAVGTSLIISAPNTGNAIIFGDSSDVIDINAGNTLTIGTAATANVISGSGSFKGSATSDLKLFGTGSVGTLNFTTGFQNLGTFTMDRQAATVGCVLGTPVTINTSLVLTNGLIDLVANTMTLASTCSNTFTATGNSYVIADATVGGVLSKAITATSTVYVFPIGDKVASTDGSQYSPASVNFTAGSFTTAFFGVAVEDAKHPNMTATTNFISRYWAVTTSGTFTTPTYTFGGTYLPVDVNGTESLSKANQWNGTIWSNAGGSIGSNTLSLPNCSNLTPPNHFTAGQRDKDINIVQGSTTYLTTSIYNFGSVTTGSPLDVTFTIQNLGQQLLTLGSSGGNLPSITGNPPYSLLTPYSYASPTILGMISTTPSTQTFVIRFNPATAGTFTGSITIKSDDPDEGSYVINFTGIGILPAPEINVKGVIASNPTIVSGDTTPDSLDNTQFAATNIGSTQTKIFRIENIGYLGLNVPTITTSNTTDFTVTSSAPYTNIPFSGTNYVDFTITFNPQVSGLRTSTISIANDDATGSENPYTFAVEGNGVCVAATISSVTPASGPVGTHVTITASGVSLAGATVTFNSVSATVLSSSATQLVVVVPPTATTGNINIAHAVSGCVTSIAYTVTKVTGTCSGLNELIMTEVYDSTLGSLGYIEVYNGTGSTIDLTPYFIRRFGDAAALVSNTYTDYAFSPGITSIATGTVRYGRISADTNTASPNFDFAPLAGGINGDDILYLYHGTTIVDVYVVPNGTAGYTAKRNVTTSGPNTTSNPSDWTHTNTPSIADLGTFAYSPPASTIPSTTNPADVSTCQSTASFSVTGTLAPGPGALTYQWYYNSGVAATWTALVAANSLAGVVASGFTSNTLTLDGAIGTYNGYQFYCNVIQNTTCGTASNAAQLAVSASTWDGTTWVGGTPSLTVGAIINGNYDTSVNGNIEACSVVVNNTFTLSVKANNYVLIQNSLTVSTGGTATFENNSSLVQINNVANSGNITYKRIAQQRKSDYVYWSSPVSGFNLSSHPSDGYKFLWNTTLNNANGTQGNWQTASGVMNAGQGYIVSGPSTFNNTANQNLEVPFLGVPRNGDYSVTIYRGTYTGANYTLPAPNNHVVTNLDDNWNLLGNPYPSAISCRGFLTNNNTPLTGALYIWTHGTLPSTSTSNPFYNTFFSNYNAATDYVPFNLTGNLANPNPDYYIGAGQGFFVTMKDGAAGSATVNFDNSLRDKTYVNATGTNFFRTSPVSTHADIEGPEFNRIWIDLVKDNQPPVRTMFGYVSGATMQRDNLYDAISKRDGSLKIYSLQSDESFVIQGRSIPFEENDIVPLGMDIIQSGDYKIALAIVDGVFSNVSQNIYLEDKYLNIIYDLRQNPYSFSSVAGTFDDRFVIRYTNSALGTPDFGTTDNNVVVAANHGEMTIKSFVENIQEVTVYDMLGRKLYFAKAINNANFVTSNISMSYQTLIVKIKLESGVTISRKIIL
ncbi:choice-of-anchor D domain-containing protein [Flavobacterium sangjuense]|uniref:LTD domain-containing protein n=1 Tax=Flavobacterium sangjuense TaxID=2518177 RepID=A0A4P7PR37_9FLAO|nr:choice-of-anchor D domain-containing protein [Flavobacterium sangjuense]QBZ97318.1 hypothetical protein GS03_00804 [Flavobacterium sangjuense]